jgi:hypothetical protein
VTRGLSTTAVGFKGPTAGERVGLQALARFRRALHVRLHIVCSLLGLAGGGAAFVLLHLMDCSPIWPPAFPDGCGLIYPTASTAASTYPSPRSRVPLKRARLP